MRKFAIALGHAWGKLIVWLHGEPELLRNSTSRAARELITGSPDMTQSAKAHVRRSW